MSGIYVHIHTYNSGGPGSAWDGPKQARPDGEYYERTQGALDFLRIGAQQKGDIPAGSSTDECIYVHIRTYNGGGPGSAWDARK